MKLSKPTLILTLLLALLGVGAGINIYVSRSSKLDVNDPANNAITQHVILAIVTLIVTTAVVARAKKRSQPSPLRAPFTVQAYNRAKATLLFKKGVDLVNVLRFVVTLFLMYMLLWEPFRAAMEPFAAMDPNARANAWGGPTYVGSTLAHWLDGFVLFYVAAFLLNLVLVKQSAKK
jgi:hypothetical protein